MMTLEPEAMRLLREPTSEIDEVDKILDEGLELEVAVTLGKWFGGGDDGLPEAELDSVVFLAGHSGGLVSRLTGQ
jgi:hypothetical protein